MSRIIKISNVFTRGAVMTPEDYEALYDDMEEELTRIGNLERLKIIRNGEERIGCEVGSVFVEFRERKSAENAVRTISGRVYDGNEIKIIYVDEDLYYTELRMI